MTTQRSIPFGKPWITDDERKAVTAVLQGPVLTHGPEGKAFEEEFGAFIGRGAHCVSLSSCMAALHLAYLQLGVGPGDEVIVPAQTHVATVHAVEWVGAKPIFVDCDPATGNLTAERIEAALTPKTKALSVVHLLGIPCGMTEIMALAERRGLKVVEDCAVALGSRYRRQHVGLFGDAGCFSFYPVKHITTGEGGMLVTRRKDVAAGVDKLRAFGVDRTHGERSVPGLYDVPTLGLNYRMSELQAALGRQQIARIEENLERRRDNFYRLKSHLGKQEGVLVLDAVEESQDNSHYCFSAVLLGELGKQRNEIVARLQQRGVGTSVYYPQPVPRMTYYRDKYGYRAEDFPNAARISDQSIALPVGPHLTPADMDYIAESFVQATQATKEMQ
jgi:perosamine synthetase